MNLLKNLFSYEKTQNRYETEKNNYTCEDHAYILHQTLRHRIHGLLVHYMEKMLKGISETWRVSLCSAQL